MASESTRLKITCLMPGTFPSLSPLSRGLSSGLKRPRTSRVGPHVGLRESTRLAGQPDPVEDDGEPAKEFAGVQSISFQGPRHRALACLPRPGVGEGFPH